jgi:hypothetical protein
LCQFQFHYHNIQLAGTQPAALRAFNSFLQHAAPRALLTNLSGVVSGAGGLAAMPGRGLGASWYRSLDHSTAHTDNIRTRDENRRLTFVLRPASDGWKHERDGGGFVWCSPYRVIEAAYNILALFVVSESTWHFVSPVWPLRPRADDDNDGDDDEADDYAGAAAGRKRLAVSGWFLGTNADDLAAHDARQAPGGVDYERAAALARRYNRATYNGLEDAR